MPAVQAQRPSGLQHHSARQLTAQTQTTAQTTSPPKHSRTHTAPDTPTLLRLSSTHSAGTSVSSRSRRLTNPSTPTLTLTPTHVSTSSTTSPSYFSPQTASSGKEPRSPAARRPPASFSGHGTDTSRGPPITLITRGNSDFGRRTSQQQPSDFAFAQHQLAQFGLVPPGDDSRTARTSRQHKEDSDGLAESTHPPQTTRPTLSRQSSTRSSSQPPRHMASSGESSSGNASGPRSHFEEKQTVDSRHGPTDISALDGGQEDLFLNIAADNSSKGARTDTVSRSDRLRTRIARASNRQSLPSALPTFSPAQSNSTTPTASRLPSTIDTRSSPAYRRTSLLPSSSRTAREQSPITPANSRFQDLSLSPKPSFSSQPKDADLSPKDFLAQLEIGKRRPSYSDSTHTPPNRASTFRPSNLHYYSSSRDDPRTPQVETAPEAAPRADETESHGSTGAATSVWDELDELKTRIRRIEMGGKIPATSSAIISQATADRPRTANTSITTVSSSPNQQRKPNPSPSESTVGAPTPHGAHPLLGEALAKAKQHAPPPVYRVLEATASEALALAELTGSAGPQGTLHTTSSILNGASIIDRQARRKADNICRSLTELCIVLCDNKSSIASPAVRAASTIYSRRPSVQINADSPIRQSIEPESNTLPQSSPSTAMSRIEARRSSMMAGGSTTYGYARDSSQEPPTPSQLQIPTRVNRTGTSLLRTRRTATDEDEDPTMRAPSRAMTDFRDIRSTQQSRISRQYTSRQPMPDLQPSPALQPTTSLRRPTVTGSSNENHLLRDGSRRYGLERQNSPAYEKQLSAEPAQRTQFSSNRNSIGGISALGRSGSLTRRFRGTSVGE